MITDDGSFVGYETGDYVVTASFGTRSAEVPVTLSARNARRPVEIVGRLPRSLFTTEEVWIHPNGRIAYLGSGSGGDRMYAIDILDPAKPVVTDSIVANTRRVNDIMTTPDGKFLVFTREGASDRKNGLVIVSLDDPAHPKPIAEFTDGDRFGVRGVIERHDDESVLTVGRALARKHEELAVGRRHDVVDAARVCDDRVGDDRFRGIQDVDRVHAVAARTAAEVCDAAVRMDPHLFGGEERARQPPHNLDGPARVARR